jgi:hypothetical protein
VKTIALLALPVVAACGRMGFDPSGNAAPDAPLDHLTCGAPAQFSVGATTSNFGATATPRGYDVFTVDSPGDVLGFTYEFEMGTLVQKANDVALASNATGPVVSIALGDQLLLAVPYGPNPAGTQLLPLDAQLAKPPQPIMNDGWFGSVSTLAPTSSGMVAFLGQLGNMEVEAKLVSPEGVDLEATAHPVIDKAEAPSVLTILPTRTGFLVLWAASTPSPNEVRAELLDEQLAVTAPPITISADIELPRVGYSAASDTFTFAWVQKTSMGDQIWVSVRDGALRETQHLMIGAGFAPKVIAGDSDFLVVWENGSQLDGARVTADGKATLHSVVGSGGSSKFAGWSLVVRNGQSAVAWVESGGTGPNLRLDPLCN